MVDVAKSPRRTWAIWHVDPMPGGGGVERWMGEGVEGVEGVDIIVADAGALAP